MLLFSDVSVLKLKDYTNEPASFLAWLLNHHELKVPFVENPIKDVIANSNIYFGYDIGLIRNKNTNHERHVVTYLLRSSPAKVTLDALDFLLKIPCEFTLTQSFVYAKQMISIGKINTQKNKIISSSAITDEELILLDSVQNLIQNNKIYLGNYHSVLTIFGDSAKQASDYGIYLESAFST